MQAEHIALGFLQPCEKFLKIQLTVLDTGIIVVIPPALSLRALPAVVVEIGVGRIHYTMQYNVVAMCIDKPLAVHMKCGEWFYALCRSDDCGTDKEC